MKSILIFTIVKCVLLAQAFDGMTLVTPTQGGGGGGTFYTHLMDNDLNEINTWMSHMDQVTKVPPNWNVIARSSNDIIAAISNEESSRMGLQFHPEVIHTQYGKEILRNFLIKIAKLIEKAGADRLVLLILLVSFTQLK